VPVWLQVFRPVFGLDVLKACFARGSSFRFYPCGRCFLFCQYKRYWATWRIWPWYPGRVWVWQR